MRECKVCGIIKPLESFAKAGTIKGVDYYRWKCVKCYSKIKMARKERLRRWYKEWKKGLKCEICGLNDYRVLEFDHLDATEKKFDVGDCVNKGVSIGKILEEAAKCQVLCANCHRIKTYEERHRDVG